MATQMTQAQAEQLAAILHDREQDAELEGNTAERNVYRAAVESLRRWLSEGGPIPAAAAEYVHLLDDGEGSDAVDEINAAEAPPAAISPDGSGPVAPETEDQPLSPDAIDTIFGLDAPDEGSAEPSTLVFVEEENFADREFRLEMERARRELQSAASSGDAGALSAARSQVDYLRSRNPNAEEARLLADEAATAVNQAIAEARRLGDEYRGQGLVEQARAQYDFILHLDGDDRQADDALREIERAIVAGSGDERLSSLRRGLRETRDLKVLQQAVRDAETLEDAGRLPSDLVDLLKSARQVFDEKRLLQGEMTTFARFGDLAARKKAVQDIIRQMVDEGAMTIWDSARGESVPIGRALEEAQRFYEQESEKVARYELNIVAARLPGYPDAALKHLREVMERREPEPGETGVQYVRHFEPNTVTRLLVPREGELEKMVDALQRAQARVDQAERAEDRLAALRLLLEAESVYPGMIDLKARLELVRTEAMRRLTHQMDALHNRARQALADEQFGEAEKAVQEADEISVRWPEKVLPAELAAAKGEGEELRADIKARRELRADFDRLAGRVRTELLDPAKRAEALELYNLLITEARYAPLKADLEQLRIFVNANQDTGEQLAELRRYIEAEMWVEARSLAERVLKSGKAGDSGKEVQELSDLAGRELEIKAALDDLDNQDVLKARDRLRIVFKAAGAEDRKELNERLQATINTINASVQEKEMGPLYNEALKLAGRPEPQHQFQALRLFRYVAGDLSQKTDSDPWAAYALSSHTADARKQASELREKMRRELLPGIESAAQTIGKGQPKEDDSLIARAADHARLLGQAALLDTSEERDAADTLIIFQGRCDAQARERNRDWAEAIAIWTRLDQEYPRRVAHELRRARIEGAIREADRLIADDRVEDATAALQKAMSEDGIGESWELYLKQVDILAAQSNFQIAFERVRRVQDLPAPPEEKELIDGAVERKQRWLQREQGIVTALAKADVEQEAGRFKEAVTVLNNAAQEPALKDSRRLSGKLIDVFRRGSDFLLDEYNRAIEGASQENKTQAVVRLAELDELEKLAGVAENQRKATALLEPLKPELVPSIRSTIEQAVAFDPAGDSLDRALEKATDLSKRLQTFRRIAPALGVELGTEARDLEREGPRISNIVDQLRQLRQLLGTVDDSQEEPTDAQQLWNRAVVSGNFSSLDTVRNQIRATNLANSPQAIAFQERLDEWAEIRTTIMERIGDITQNFVSGTEFPVVDGEKPEQVENFGEALRVLRSLRQMPATRRDNRSTWRQLSQKDYARIVELMGPLLVIADTYEEKELRGWQHVEEAAAIRLREVNAWTQWEYGYTQHMNVANTRVGEAQSLPSTPLIQRQLAWQAVDDALVAAQQMLAEPVQIEGDDVAVRTHWAELISRRAENARRTAEQWRSFVAAQMPHASALHFPDVHELDAAARMGREALQAKLAEAERVGPSNDEERNRLAHFRDRVLPTMGVEQATGFMGKLKQLFGG